MRALFFTPVAICEVKHFQRHLVAVNARKYFGASFLSLLPVMSVPLVLPVMPIVPILPLKASFKLSIGKL